MEQKYQKFLQRVQELYDINYAQDLLSWDQETYMPRKGSKNRGRSQGTLAGIYHEKLTDPTFVAMVEDLKQANLNGDAAVNLREVAKKQGRALKIPRDLVVELSDTQSLAYEAWVEAREKSDFKTFAPWMEKLIRLQRRMAELVGFEGSEYNALLSLYEPEITAEEMASLFATLRNRLVSLLDRIEIRECLIREILEQQFPIDRQETLNKRILKDMGFDLEAGRLDVTVHPFCCGLCREDVRVTTRYTDRWPEPLFSTMHEAGHGLYEQGLPADAAGTPAGESLTPGIHESQSRLWENMIARSRQFLGYYLPLMKDLFSELLRTLDLESLYAAVNHVRPSLIRTEADEVTYNLHIILRFEIEKEMMEGTLKVEDLPQVWNERMEKYLGIRPDNDAHGVLQDVHWSIGFLGYFPTYTLGNLYSAQFFHQVQKEIPDLMGQIAEGRLTVLKKWLNEKIHSRGKRLKASELVTEVTGEPLNIDYFIHYLEDKFTPFAP